MSIPQIPSPAEHPALYSNSNSQILVASIILVVLPTLVFALRLTSRWIAGAGFWWDDFFIGLGMFFSWGINIVMILSSRASLGHHMLVLPLPAIQSFFRYLYSFTLLYSLSISCVKVGVLLFQWRIFPIVSFRRVLLWVGAIIVAYSIACNIVFIFPCTPIDAYWTNLSSRNPGQGHCVTIQTFMVMNGALNTVTDFVVLMLPLPLLLRLKASRLQKCILAGIFLSGVVVTGISMVRLIVLNHYRGEDITYDFVDAYIWTSAEPSIAVASACLPSLRPLIVRLLPLTSPPRARNEGHDNGYDSSKNLTSTWGSKALDRSFNRLPDSHSINVAIEGGKGEEYALETGSQEDEPETPVNRIRAKTTVVLTVSDKVDWRDDLY